VIDWKRWGIASVHKIGDPGDPYLDRYRLLQTPLFAVYLHRIHRADLEADGHDHPWWFFRLVLWGSYREWFWPNKDNSGWSGARQRRWLSMGPFSRRAAHRIDEIYGRLWTLVITGPDHGEWGFWRDGGYIPWRSYLALAEQSRRHGDQPWNTIVQPGIRDQ
jgi:hypothetical protein